MVKLKSLFILLLTACLAGCSACGHGNVSSEVSSSEHEQSTESSVESSDESESDDTSDESDSNSESDSSTDETDSSTSSDDTLEEENEFVLTFKLSEVDGGTQIVLQGEERLSKDDERIPALPICEEIGYHYVWDTDFTTLAQSATITAVKIAKTYTVYLDAKGGELAVECIIVTYGEVPNIPTPTETQKAKGFMGWYYGSTKLNLNKAWSIDADGITLNAVWSEGSSWTGDYS